MRGTRFTLAAVLLLAAPHVARAQASDPLAPVAARVRAHDDAGALRALEALPASVRATGPAHYVEGRLLERLGHRSRAADAYGAVGDGVPSAAAHDAEARRATLLAHTGRCAEARPLLEALGRRHDDEAAVARALSGECALSTGDLPRALGLLAKAAREDASNVDTFALRLELADAQRRAGHRDEAVTTLRALYLDRPAHPEADQVRAALEALGAPATLDRDDHMARAERLVRAHDFRDALTELDAAGPPQKRADRAHFLHLRGTALYHSRRYTDAAHVLHQASALGAPTAADDAFYAARALARADRDRQAIDAFRRLVHRWPRDGHAPEAEYMAAWLGMRHGFASGTRAMQRFLASPRAQRDPGLLRDALWQLGFHAFEHRRFVQAADLLGRYAQTGTGAMVRGRGLYWVGRARMAARQRGKAVEAFRGVLAIDPLHWYGLLARDRLVAAGVDPGPPFGTAVSTPIAAPPPPPADATPPPDVAFFERLGLLDDAREALEADEGAVSRAASAGKGLETLVATYAALGDATRAFRLTARGRAADLGHAPRSDDRWVWWAAYPRPWPQLVAQAAQGVGLPVELVYAVMRQESAYDPEAVSYADARGLMQLMPRTAEHVARDAGIELDESMLFDPIWNVRLGTTYLATLTRSLALPLAIGAYNAGVVNMRRWLTRAGPMDLDRFVEQIPVDQTRNYIRRVVSHYAHYLYLTHPSAGFPRVPLPDRVGP